MEMLKNLLSETPSMEAARRREYLSVRDIRGSKVVVKKAPTDPEGNRASRRKAAHKARRALVTAALLLLATPLLGGCEHTLTAAEQAAKDAKRAEIRVVAKRIHKRVRRDALIACGVAPTLETIINIFVANPILSTVEAVGKEACFLLKAKIAAGR